MQKGLFITFEGIDGSGKTTQINHFIERLGQRGIAYKFVREPGGTPIGEKIRAILLDVSHREMCGETEILLYSASRFQLTEQLIRPALASGKIVVCDRFYDSTTAYQGYGRGINLEFVRRLNAFATRSLQPDLTFLLDVSLEKRTDRIRQKTKDRLEKEHNDFQARVRKGFLEIAAKEKDRWIVIDGGADIESISQIVWQHFIEKWEGT